MFHVTVLPGDGIGPEIIESAINVLKVAAIKYNIEIHFTSYDFGGISIDRHGVPVTSQVLDACIHSDAVLLGAVEDRLGTVRNLRYARKLHFCVFEKKCRHMQICAP